MTRPCNANTVVGKRSGRNENSRWRGTNYKCSSHPNDAGRNGEKPLKHWRNKGVQKKRRGRRSSKGREGMGGEGCNESTRLQKKTGGIGDWNVENPQKAPAGEREMTEMFKRLKKGGGEEGAQTFHKRYQCENYPARVIVTRPFPGRKGGAKARGGYNWEGILKVREGPNGISPKPRFVHWPREERLPTANIA